MPKTESFYSSAEDATSQEFLAKGYLIRDVADRAALDAIRDGFVAFAAKHLGINVPKDPVRFLNRLHDIVPVEKLNDLRLGAYRALNAETWFRPTYFELGRPYINDLVGNELAMQNRINLSIQMPSDRTALLDIHADVFSGETPYQVVQWVPLVDVAETKSMFFLEKPKSDEVSARFKDFSDRGMTGLFEAVRDDVTWIKVDYGQVLIFSPNCLHGNVLNDTEETRWSLNCRFTGLFTPYVSAEKSLGSFYLPITPRPVTRVGMAFRLPGGFEE